MTTSHVPMMRRCTRLVVASLATLAVTAALAQSAPPPNQGKLITSYSEWAGSSRNATSLVNGLRDGTKVTLTEPSSIPGTPDTVVSFIAPTKPMGYGNIRIALALAKSELAAKGVTDPTPLELQNALLGTVAPDGTTTQGILQMRASGMGWGAIANSLGFKLGEVMRATPADKATTSPAKAEHAVKTSSAGKGQGKLQAQTHSQSQNDSSGSNSSSSKGGNGGGGGGGSGGSSGGGGGGHGGGGR